MVEQKRYLTDRYQGLRLKKSLNYIIEAFLLKIQANFTDGIHQLDHPKNQPGKSKIILKDFTETLIDAVKNCPSYGHIYFKQY